MNTVGIEETDLECVLYTELSYHLYDVISGYK